MRTRRIGTKMFTLARSLNLISMSLLTLLCPCLTSLKRSTFAKTRERISQEFFPVGQKMHLSTLNISNFQRVSKIHRKELIDLKLPIFILKIVFANTLKNSMNKIICICCNTFNGYLRNKKYLKVVLFQRLDFNKFAKRDQIGVLLNSENFFKKCINSLLKDSVFSRNLLVLNGVEENIQSSGQNARLLFRRLSRHRVCFSTSSYLQFFIFNNSKYFLESTLQAICLSNLSKTKYQKNSETYAISEKKRVFASDEILHEVDSRRLEMFSFFEPGFIILFRV